ncbi:hypothetical protein LDH09_17315, partial [Mycobacterium tuberculosis]
GLRWGVESICT